MAIPKECEVLADQIAAWNCENVKELVVLIKKLQVLVNELEDGTRIEDLVNWSALPTATPVPEELHEYPVWAIDERGYALIGEDGVTVRSMVDVWETHNDNG